jgi:hypothetical protein
MPDENNNWQCAPNSACDEKVLKVKTIRKLDAQGASNEEIDEEIEELKQKFKQGKSLATIKSELRVEVGDMSVLNELDDEQPRGKVFGIQTQGTSPTGSEINNLNTEIDALKVENEALKQRLAAIEDLLNHPQTETPQEQPSEEPAPTKGTQPSPETPSEPETPVEETPPSEEATEPPVEQPTEQPSEPDQPAEQPPTEEPAFGITGAGVWNFLASINPFAH